MKLGIQTLSVLFLTLLSIQVFHSQSEELTEKDVNDLRDNATKMLKTVAYRLTTTTEDFDDKDTPARETYVSIKTFAPPDNSHFKWQRKNADGVTESESIYVAGNRYDKAKTGEWKLANPTGSGIGTGSGGGSGTPLIPDVKVKITHKKDQRKGNSLTQFYEINRQIRFLFKNGELTRYSNRRYWFNQDGTLARSELESYSKNSKALHREVSTYEYDPNIKIEAPIK